MTVFLWGTEQDAVVAAVAAALKQIGAEIILSDGSDISACDCGRGIMIVRGARHDLREVTGILVRPPANADPAIYGAIAGWVETTSAATLNRLSSAASNRSKPYQLALLHAAGFNVPDTLVTTDPSAVLAFKSEHGRLIYKSVSGVRSIVKIFEVNDEKRLQDIESCPTQFQQYIAGVDHRVHVVSGTVFSIRIDSPSVDYRYASMTGESSSMTSVTLPAAVAARCRRVTTELGLELAGIDLRLDEHGRWWCFEVNTAPGFIWFEQQTGQPIAEAIARRLAPEFAPRWV